ncbi:glycoside hydrolase family 32 protein [Cyclobacterium sp. 1_MG-2023]|uniref:glycoside hydrolase family 32 protein n=1 Tax=Cyclobacterium sp. 1_MG-2023 TaxID=3062681 RepID=UPI0026E30993|nr:glycoside hydrolase family 32 protein [Cyclobacterium sp. 1_MG-2023]MDO6437661.1 glycoside hydrolase family 32 protein [Cyclobacterium sp. 1_MG-2023]
MNLSKQALVFFLISLIGFSCTSQVKKMDDLADQMGTYKEAYRPQFHFSPPANWMNDPNGMVFHKGEYHLFYQYYPDSNVWGPMHWGHAVSKNLVEWENLPVAIAPDSLGWIFSGSAVLDSENSSGLGTQEAPPLVAIYTYHDNIKGDAGRIDFQTQGIAYSLDNGRSWEKYKANPVLANPGIKDFRDPKVRKVVVEGKEKWIMSLAVKDKISFYSSPNLIEWSHMSDFNPEWAAYGGVWECPDLFPLKTQDGKGKWVLLVSINPGGPNGGSATQYFVGDFDGQTFTTNQKEVKWLDHGTDNYAGVTWSNIPASDGRTLFIGWMSNWNYAQVVPTKVWRSAMTVPRTLSLYENKNELWIASKPVEELEQLRGQSASLEGENIALEHELLEIALKPKESDFSATFKNGSGEMLVIGKKEGKLFIDRTKSGLTDFNEEFASIIEAPLKDLEVNDIDIYLDRASIEVFVNDGALVMTALVFPTAAYTDLQLKGFETKNKLYSLKEIW